MTGSIRRLARAAALAGAGLCAARAAAAREAALVVLTGEGRPPPPDSAVPVLRTALERSGALTVQSAETMAARIESRARRAPRAAPDAPDTLRRRADEVLEAAAFGRDDEAVARGRRALADEAPRLAATNGSDGAAQALSDLCLVVVRALLHRSESEAARDQARECLRLVPDLSASSDVHPPDVLSLLSDVRQERRGRLRVTTTDPVRARCPVRVQGRPLAEAPAELDLPPGAYTVQVSCDGDGLVHDVVVRAGSAERLIVSPRLEAILSGSPSMPSSLREGPEPIDGARLAELAEWLRADELWVLERSGDAIRITRSRRTPEQRLDVRGRAAVALEPARTFEQRLDEAGRQLLCDGPRCRDGSTPAAHGTPLRTWGLVGGGAGVLAMGAAWAGWARYESLDSDLRGMLYDEPGYAAQLAERDRWALATTVTSAGGSALFVLAAPLWLPQERTVPAWSWAVGAAGVAAVGAGTVLWSENGDLERAACPVSERCWRHESTVPFAPLLVTQGAALLSLPLTYVVRSWLRDDAGSLEVRAATSELGLVWRGNLTGL